MGNKRNQRKTKKGRNQQQKVAKSTGKRKRNDAQSMASKSMEQLQLASAVEAYERVLDRNDGRFPYAQTALFLSKYPGVTIGQIHGKLRQKKQKTNVSSEVSEASSNVSDSNKTPSEEDGDDVDDVEEPRNKGGRKKGSTKEAKRRKEAAQLLAWNQVAERYCAMKRALPVGQTHLGPGDFNEIVVKVCDKLGIPEYAPHINYYAINKRYARSRPQTDRHGGPDPPLLLLEPILLDFIVTMEALHRPLKPSGIIQLAMELIEDSPLEHRLLAFQKARDIVPRNATKCATLTMGWYRGFMKRNADLLVSKRPHAHAIDRKKWANKRNFEIFYSLLYDRFVDCGIAQKMDEERWFDIDGNIVDSEEAFGLKSRFHMEHPEFLFFVDEMGMNTNMKTDGNVGGERTCGKRGVKSRVEASTTDNRWSVLPVFAGDGSLVTQMIILKAEVVNNNVAAAVAMGFDITAPVEHHADPHEFIRLNSGVGKAFCGFPTIEWRGYTLPTLVVTSASGGMQDDLLVDLYSHLDKYAVNDLRQKNLGITPVLLLDGHHSRFSMAAIEYINDDNHRWAATMGLPYATDLWQVGDAEECNGTIRMNSVKAKRMILEIKRRLCLEPRIELTDVAPLTRLVTELSFSDPTNVKKAISKRGLGPLNYNLLTMPEIAENVEDIARELSSVVVPDTLVPESLPSSMEELRELMQMAYESGRQSKEEEHVLASVNTELVSPQPTAEQLTITLKPDSSAGDCFRQMLAIADLDKHRQAAKANQQQGEQQKKALDQMKKITSGVYWHSGRIALDDRDLFDVIHAHAADAQQQTLDKEARLKDRAKKKLDRVEAIESKDEWNKGDYSVMVGVVKPKDAVGDDGKKISHSKLDVAELKQLWEKWKHRLSACKHELSLFSTIEDSTIEDGEDGEDGGGSSDSATEPQDPNLNTAMVPV